MATYKKRGYKPASKKERDKAIEEQSTTAGVFNTLDESASKTEQWVAKNQKHIFTFIGAVALIALVYVSYQHFILGPKDKEAAAEFYQAESYFLAAQNSPAKDSLYQLALHGGDGKFGLLRIVEDYGSTATGNIAKYYAGMAYMNTNQPQEAIKYLQGYKTKEAITGALALGNMGDAYASLGQKEEALKYYKKAASFNENEFTTPLYLLKAAKLALLTKNYPEALQHLNKIQNDFPASTEANQVASLIAQAEAGTP